MALEHARRFETSYRTMQIRGERVGRTNRWNFRILHDPTHFDFTTYGDYEDGKDAMNGACDLVDALWKFRECSHLPVMGGLTP